MKRIFRLVLTGICEFSKKGGSWDGVDVCLCMGVLVAQIDAVLLSPRSQVSTWLRWATNGKD